MKLSEQNNRVFFTYQQNAGKIRFILNSNILNQGKTADIISQVF